MYIYIVTRRWKAIKGKPIVGCRKKVLCDENIPAEVKLSIKIERAKK
jgi:hypothetical protein